MLTDVRSRLAGERHAYCTTFFDFYGLPSEFPGKAQASGAGVAFAKSQIVTDAVVERLRAVLGGEPLRRFVPYVQMYEFEALLFSDSARLANGIGSSGLTPAFQRIRDAFDSPGEINDSPMTAPGKRIQQLQPGYQKPLHGVLAALEIGLDTIRAECPQFNAWVGRLETLAPLR